MTLLTRIRTLAPSTQKNVKDNKKCSVGVDTKRPGTLKTKQESFKKVKSLSSAFGRVKLINKTSKTSNSDNVLEETERCDSLASEGSLLSQANIDRSQPSFEFMGNFISEDERKVILHQVELGSDPSSKHFAERHKAIRFVSVINRRVQCFSQDYFVQNSGYNDFSGGYKRHYKLIPEEVCMGELHDAVLKFTDYYGLPEKTVILMQIQTTLVKPLHKTRRESITGQGIHTDGSDRAALVCLHRGNGVEGALNRFHGNLDGSSPLCEPTILEPGTAVFFKDNEIYHHVSPGCLKEGSSDNEEARARTILLMHSPAEIYMQGLDNRANCLGRRESEIKLRVSALANAA